MRRCWGRPEQGEGLDALLPELGALASDLDPELADAADSACDWLDGARDEG